MDRVRTNTSTQQNKALNVQLERNIEYYSTADKRRITKRIEELDREWDIEKMLETNMPVIAVSGLALGAFVNRKWLALPAIVLGFFLQHAIQGWCPLLPLYRKLGYRTRKEIDKERYALKFLRGDFQKVKRDNKDIRQNPEQLIDAINA